MQAPLSLERDLIAGLATPSGYSGVAIIRLSGPDLLNTVLPLFTHKTPLTFESFLPRQLKLLHVVDPESKEMLDQALVAYFPMPHSFTGEDQMEIQCHGAPVVIQSIFSALSKVGIRTAQPGEFSRRAFHNGKMDLTQAEALMSLIHASTQRAARESMKQMQGSLSLDIHSIRDQVLTTLAHIEACLDFSDEDIEPFAAEELLDSLLETKQKLQKLLKGAEFGEQLQNGFDLVIAGPPNAGKSSLYNRLIGHDKAIVTSVPGTTRDLNEHALQIQGVPVMLVDTAGLRHTDEIIEKEGILRAEHRLEQADGILFMVDVQKPLTDDLIHTLSKLDIKRTLIVANKSDLIDTELFLVHPSLIHFQHLLISCHTGEGVQHLIETIPVLFSQPSEGDSGTLIMVSRQKESLKSSLESLCEAISLIKRCEPWEVVAIPLRSVLEALGAVSGETRHEHLLDTIFSSFCIGK